MVHYSAFRMSGYAIGHSFLAISPSLLIGFEKQLPAEFNIYIDIGQNG